MPRLPVVLNTQTIGNTILQQSRSFKTPAHSDRIHVISPKLCGQSLILPPGVFSDCLDLDDAIRRLAPSLEVYKGCDIIDINPGVCIWSSKLHNFLQPRRHILVEPQAKVYKQWLQPLLDGPGSRYRSAKFDTGKKYWNLHNYVAKGLLPDQEVLAAPDSAHTNNNPTLLILANMGRYSKVMGNRPSLSKTADSHYQILEYVRSLESMTGFHSKGVVRMLMWMPDDEKIPILPRTTFYRRRLSVYGELSCHIEEIIGGVFAPHGARREADIDLQSCECTADRMTRSSVQIPAERLDEMPRLLREIGPEALMERAKHSAGTVHGQRDWHHELHELRQAFADKNFSQRIAGSAGQGDKRRAMEELKMNPEYQRFVSLQKTEKAQRSTKALIDRLLRHENEIRAEYLAIWQETSLDSLSRDKRLQGLDNRIEHYKELLGHQRKSQLSRIASFTDDRAAWNTDPPLLLWDQRTAEPIIAQSEEFRHPRPLALLDFRPKPILPFCLTATQRKYLDVMLLVIFTSPGNSIGAALDTMAPGAAAALIPHAPSLVDPCRGGRRDLDQLRVRRLTTEMLRELAVAWENWSFRPALTDLSRIVSSAAVERI